MILLISNKLSYYYLRSLSAHQQRTHSDSLAKKSTSAVSLFCIGGILTIIDNHHKLLASVVEEKLGSMLIHVASPVACL